MVDNSGTMEDGPVPLFAGCLLLCEAGAAHLDMSDPSAFNDTIGALYFGGGCDDLGLVVVCPLEALAPHEFLIELGMESAGKSAYVSAEFGEGADDFV